MTLDDIRKRPPLTDEEVNIIKSAKATPSEDCPEQTREQLAQYRPWYAVHPQGNDIYKVSVKKTAVQIRIDNDVLAILKSQGKGYQTRINEILRQAVFSQGNTPRKQKERS